MVERCFLGEKYAKKMKNVKHEIVFKQCNTLMYVHAIAAVQKYSNLGACCHYTCHFFYQLR